MTAQPSQPLLEGRGLSRTYRLGATTVPALSDVDITIAVGDFLVLKGPSGSGKTTLINLLGMLDRPDGGALLLDGRPVPPGDENRLADLRRDRFGFVFQTFSLVPVLTALENTEYPMVLQRVPREERRGRAAALLERVGLADKLHVRPDLLSGGERQRVAVARALAGRPELVLADEPTANLDTGTALGVLELMRELNADSHVAFVVATHDTRVVDRADRVISLRDGRVVDAA